MLAQLLDDVSLGSRGRFTPLWAELGRPPRKGEFWSDKSYVEYDPYPAIRLVFVAPNRSLELEVVSLAVLCLSLVLLYADDSGRI